jgi:hypothetical protein
MIDEKRLVKEIKNWIKTDRFEDYSAGYILSDVIDEINKMPKVGEWIPVSEKLPESDDDVIVTCKSCRTGKKFTSTDYRNCKTGEWSYFGRDVIAWQPLPEPYKEEDM